MSQRSLPDQTSFTDVEAVAMVSFYFLNVKPITEYYTRWLFKNLTTEAAEYVQHARQPTLASRSEEIRLIRAIYRFEMLCQIAGPASNTTYSSRRALVCIFLEHFNAWEIEELFSFYQFVETRYSNTFDSIRSDLHPDNPRFENEDRPRLRLVLLN